MWQEERSKPYYRFQTENREAANKMKRREKFKVVGVGHNCRFWIFQAKFSRPDIARKALKALSGSKVEFNKKEDIFYSRINNIREGKFGSVAGKYWGESYAML